jgi:hypothetical protein
MATPTVSTPAPFWRRFLAAAVRREIVARALRLSFVVGALLAVINHGLELLHLELDGTRLLRIGLTCLVPYCVATYSAAMQELAHGKTPLP